MKRPLFLKNGHKKIVCYIVNTSSERANYLVGSDYASLKKMFTRLKMENVTLESTLFLQHFSPDANNHSRT